ncbi:putative membrane protein, partial [Vibrio harveyi]
LISTN